MTEKIRKKNEYCIDLQQWVKSAYLTNSILHSKLTEFIKFNLKLFLFSFMQYFYVNIFRGIFLLAYYDFSFFFLPQVITHVEGNFTIEFVLKMGGLNQFSSVFIKNFNKNIFLEFIDADYNGSFLNLKKRLTMELLLREIFIIPQ